MSWFDAKGLNWAKTAIKEAVAHIDKALDIQDGNGAVTSAAVPAAVQGQPAATASAGNIRKQQKLPGAANRELSESQVTPIPPPTHTTEDTSSSSVTTATATSASTSSSSVEAASPSAALATSNWGSFTGSFFENPNAQQTITAPPIPGSGIVGSSLKGPQPQIATGGPLGAQRPSIVSTSTSDSVELLSPPASSSSELHSPPNSASNNSESIEAISATPTTFTNELGTTNSFMCSSTSLPDSIVIIADQDTCDKEEEDSLSYKTVVGEAPEAVEPEAATSLQCTTVSTSAHLGTTFDQSLISTSSCSPNQNMLISMEETQSDSHHADSDSTQSFEDVQMQTSSTASQCLAREQAISVASDEKIDSFKTTSSPHNSNDEMETTTSSDIEIISNPNGNGDSSSTNSTTRTSPLKLKKLVSSQGSSHLPIKKGHFREPSEISILSEDSQSELDKLLQRISELNEILEARELRLLHLERQSIELQERNSEMESTIELMKANNGSVDSAEAFTQRLSALEKKFQASIRERDSLRIQIKDLKDELLQKIPKEELTESNAMIAELRQEGEKLSKEILQQSNIIKKLRAKEKSTDSQMKRNKEEIVSMTDELERLKKTLNAKEDVERSQIEAVHKMSSEKRKLDEENAQYRSKLEDLQSKLSTLQASFEAAKSELQQRTRLHTDLTRTAEEALTAKKEKELTKAENQEIMQQLNELREKLREFEQVAAKKEHQLRDVNRDLMHRLEAAELRAETSTQEASLTTAPLMRQLESLQNTLSQRTNLWNQEEKILIEKLDAAQGRLKSLEHMETRYEERIELLQKRCAELENKLSHALMQEEKSEMGLQQVQLECDVKESSLNKQIGELQDKLSECRSKMDELEQKNKSLEDKQRAETEERLQSYRVTEELVRREQDRDKNREVASISQPPELMYQQSLEQSFRSQSPAMSFGRNSLEEAMEGAPFDWQTEDMECISNSGRHPSNLPYGMHLNFMGHNASTLEHLQSMLKQRDGEIVHIQWELARLQESRSVLSEEIGNLTTELENAKEKLVSCEALEKSHAELQHNYDALLQMYGEKVERTEELELDLYELKEAYKTQIDELLAQPRRAT